MGINVEKEQGGSLRIGDAKIIDNNETYLIKDSVLPAYVDEFGCVYVVEEYEEGCPCEHTIEDLVKDGVKISFITNFKERGKT